jgi:hypothetical protein
MTKEEASKVYDVLVRIGGASESDRSGFVYHHVDSKDGCSEWRFCGKLGFGGKYRSGSNRVSCYQEDQTPSRVCLIETLNTELAEIKITKK